MHVFRDFEPELAIYDALKPKELFAAKAIEVKTPFDLLNSQFWRFFDRFGVFLVPPEPFEALGPSVEISPVSTTSLWGLDGQETLSDAVLFAYDTSVLVSQPAVFLCAYFSIHAGWQAAASPVFGE